jgi:hypothetical protein
VAAKKYELKDGFGNTIVAYGDDAKRQAEQEIRDAQREDRDNRRRKGGKR